MTQEGGTVTYLDANSSQMGKKSLEDSAKVLGRFSMASSTAAMPRGNVELLAKHSGVPGSSTA